MALPHNWVSPFLFSQFLQQIRDPKSCARDANRNFILGCRQMARHQTLTLAFVGSSPAIPAMDSLSPNRYYPYPLKVKGNRGDMDFTNLNYHFFVCGLVAMRYIR